MNSLKISDDAAAAVAIAPRVTLQDIEAKIACTDFVRFGVLTICVLTLANGYTVTGESAAASPENFDEALGEKFAREAAVRKVWPLEGYLLRERLHQASVGDQVPT